MRTVLTLTLITLLGAVLAGCISDDGNTGKNNLATTEPEDLWILDSAGNALTAEDFGGELPAFDILVSSDRISGEPTIGVTRTGAVFYAAIDFDVDVAGQTTLPSTWYMRSTDGGESWANKSPQMGGVATHPTSFDPYVYVDPTTGRVYAMDMGPHVACNKVSWSDDDGDTWMTREGACIPGVNDHPTLFAGPAIPATNTAVYPNQLYLCTNQITDSICYTSPDGGLNWAATTPPYIGYDAERASPSMNGALNGLCGGLHGHGHASWADGTIYLGRGYCGDTTVATSHDGGITWTVNTIAEAGTEYQPTEHDVSVATDRSGNAYAFWIGNKGQTAWLSISKDKGASWSEPINATAPGVTAVKLASIVAGEDGRIAFLYVGSDNPLGWAVDDQECEDVPGPVPFVTGSQECEWKHPNELHNTTWNAYVGLSLNADTENPVLAIKMANDADEPLKRGPCGGRCFGDEGGMYDFLDIDIDPTTGQVWAALVDVCSGDCDGAGKGKFDEDMREKAVGAVAKMVLGTPLLDAPIAER